MVTLIRVTVAKRVHSGRDHVIRAARRVSVAHVVATRVTPENPRGINALTSVNGDMERRML
ncbi:hypothetical protein [Virgisporangium aurantiacum]|uniref:Uncharacterized protein n=1 Tax=Virgisporangium aurantiacum TaxID=175570 RepID=A0A8J3YY70_9ACTN|nr:hypothetical protein [Virgisporangium aurantiacum]GIJ52732.1 hypothetical protein Vau01_002480 [Virgisporangium aurantiacum]